MKAILIEGHGEELKEMRDNALIIDVNGTTEAVDIEIIHGVVAFNALVKSTMARRGSMKHNIMGLVLIFKNIASSHRELLVLQIPPPDVSLVQDRLSTANGDDGERQNEDDMHEDSENKVHLHTTHVAFREVISVALKADNNDEHISKEKQHASRFELTDEEHPTIIRNKNA
ncbi:hypothetical protein HAX54_010721, partial [Datura stramonium]|nr:hypothetical protein [Datura stramonium]